MNEPFDGFKRGKVVKLSYAVAMTEYSEDLAHRMHVLFRNEALSEIMGEIVAQAGLKQLRMAETEKYPHVTFFFNGGEEKNYPGEDRIMVPSPKVATYDLQPQMSAPELTDKLIAEIESQKYDFILINYANPDMVGHTGILEAAIKAVATVDGCLGRVMNAVKKVGGTMFVTADHGNAETMRDPVTGEPHTSHTLNPVKAALFNAPAGIKSLRAGRLADVAPTLLALLQIAQPKGMTGQSLLDSPQSAQRAS
jgi:2,3-bisphosphoglycerate-independent phosphoglycerate mutase